MRDRYPDGERREQRREGLGVRQGVEAAALPVALEDDVIMAADDQRPGTVLAGVGGGGFQGPSIERLELGRHARGGRLVTAGEQLARRRRAGVSPP